MSEKYFYIRARVTWRSESGVAGIREWEEMDLRA